MSKNDIAFSGTGKEALAYVDRLIMQGKIDSLIQEIKQEREMHQASEEIIKREYAIKVLERLRSQL